MKRTLEERAANRAAARQTFFSTLADARAQLSPAALADYLKSMLRTRSRKAAAKSVKQITAHRGLLSGIIVSVAALIIISVFNKPRPTSKTEFTDE
jgi:cytochrome c biogenesis protein ResB